MEVEQTKLYGECAYILDKIFDKCESMNGGWDELLNHLAAIDETQYETDREYYFGFYKFVRQVYWRIHNWDESQGFNQVRKQEVQKKVEGKIRLRDGFSIHNYDYTFFKWAMEHNHTYGMSPSSIEVAAEDLTPAELKRLTKMAEKNNV